MIANTPAPPYYAVIFTNVLNGDDPRYEETAKKMTELAQLQEGFLGVESARNEIGITISYWKDLESIKKWKEQTDHLMAQQMGKDHFYKTYKTRISLVQKDYIFEKNK
jgi:heme-degrading monooxygenase HmoA